MLIDLHVHTNGYSNCSRMSAMQMAESAIAAGLDAVVLTEHNILWPAAALDELRQQYPALTIWRGFEVSAAHRHDVLVYGILDFAAFHRDMPVIEVVDTAHRLGGAAVLAHPFRYHTQLDAAVTDAAFDAIESLSINSDESFQPAIEKLATEHGIPTIYNSDGHDTISLGAYANIFADNIATEQELTAALRAGAYTPVRRPAWAAPAREEQHSRFAKRVRLLVAQGLDAAQIWKRIGGSLESIESVIDQVTDSI